MICPNCNIPMSHLNQGGGFSGTDAYQTYDTLKCLSCGARAVEVYHTEFLKEGHIGVPKIEINQSPERIGYVTQHYVPQESNR